MGKKKNQVMLSLKKKRNETNINNPETFTHMNYIIYTKV